MQTTLDLQKKIDDYLNQLPSETKTAAARFALEYRQHPDIFAGLGIDEGAYVRSRLVDEGLAALPTTGKQSKDERPAHVRNPMLAMNPKGNQCGSPDECTID